MSWPEVELGDIALILRNGASIKQSEHAGGTPITRIETIANWEVNPAKCGYADVTENEYPNHLLETGDILISHINSTKHLGKCAIYEGNPGKLIHGMNLLSLRVNTDISYPKYIYNVMCSTEFRRQIPKITKNSVNQSSFTVTNFKQLKIPLPPLEEQKRIAAILDKADTLRRKREKAIALLDDLLRSVFLDMFGDPVTNPKSLKKVRIEEVVSVKTGGTPNRNKPEYYQGNIPWVKTTEVNGKTITETLECLSEQGMSNSNCVLFPKQSIVLAMYGQGKTRGRVGVLGIEATTNQACAVLLPGKNISQDFLYEYLRLSYNQIRDLGRGGNQPNLNLSLVKNFKVFLPTENEQKEFVRRVKGILKQKSKYERFIGESNNLFSSLAQRAFRGELTTQKEAA